MGDLFFKGFEALHIIGQAAMVNQRAPSLALGLIKRA